jgi:myo-inositol-1(or 4)-monophosphatase
VKENPFAQEENLLRTIFSRISEELKKLPLKVTTKEGGSPLTTVDLFIDSLLKEKIQKAFPEDGILSEESPSLKGKERTWVVDPVDGTRELIEGIPEWVVSVALFSSDLLQYGWVYQPTTSFLFSGGPGIGAFLNNHKKTVQFRKEGEPIIGVSRTDTKKGKIPRLPIPLKPIGSIAYKLALTGVGEIGGVVSFTPKHLWDIAGGVAIVLGGGGILWDLQKKEPLTTLSLKTTSLFPEGFFAGSPEGVPWFLHQLQKSPAP